MYMDLEYNELLLFKQLSLRTSNCPILPLDSQENPVFLLKKNQNYLTIYWKQVHSALLGFQNMRKVQLVNEQGAVLDKGVRMDSTHTSCYDGYASTFIISTSFLTCWNLFLSPIPPLHDPDAGGGAHQCLEPWFFQTAGSRPEDWQEQEKR